MPAFQMLLVTRGPKAHESGPACCHADQKEMARIQSGHRLEIKQVASPRLIVRIIHTSLAEPSFLPHLDRCRSSDLMEGGVRNLISFNPWCSVNDLRQHLGHFCIM